MEQDYQAKQKAAAVGHNSGLVNPLVQEMYKQHEELAQSIKALQKDQKAIRVKAKDEFGIATRVFSIELQLRKLDVNVRAEIEQGHADLKAMLGYQMALQLAAPEPTETDSDPIEAARKKVTAITSHVTKQLAEEEEDEDDF